MGYIKTMEMAGAKIHAYKSFGSCQGDWWAKVTYEGKIGWVNGSYGSCSGCDAFQAEFDFTGHYFNEEYHSIYYDSIEGCEECKEIKERFIAFGKVYLDDILTQEEAESKAAENISWDMDAEDMLKFIKDNAI